MGLKKCGYGLIALFVLFGCACAAQPASPNIYENAYYRVSCPERVSIKTREFSDHIETDFYIQEKIGGIEYYPSSNWSDFYQYDPGDGDTDAGTFLQEQGILHPDETLDAYMFEIGTNDQSADLWENRSDIKREHFFVFTESGHCYDLWFYCDALDDSEKETIRESFQLELSI